MQRGTKLVMMTPEYAGLNNSVDASSLSIWRLPFHSAMRVCCEENVFINYFGRVILT
jgi:hypothetical protein